MIPILYEADETTYETNGLGRLADALTCEVTQETDGNVYLLTMTYPYDGIHADDLTANRIIYAEPEAEAKPQPFIIREVTKTLDGLQIIARHRSYDLTYYLTAEFQSYEDTPFTVIPLLFDKDKKYIGTLEEATVICQEVNSMWHWRIVYPFDGQYISAFNEPVYMWLQSSARHDAHLYYISLDEMQWGTSSITIEKVTNIIADRIRLYDNLMLPDQAIGNIRHFQMTSCPFKFWAVPTTANDAWINGMATFWNDLPAPTRDLIGGELEQIAGAFGGQWEFDDFNCILHESRGADRGVQYRYGKNISEITERINIDDIYTHVVAIWKGTESSSTDKSNGDYYVKKSDVISVLDPQYAAMFPNQRTLAVDASSEFTDEPATADLNNFAHAYVKAHPVGTPTVTIDVSVIDLSMSEEYEDIKSLETVHMCDTVTVVFPRYGINVKAKVTRLVYDVLNGKNSGVTIGQTTVNLADVIAENRKNIVRTKYDLQKWSDRCAERAIEALAGWYGGNIKKNFDPDDHKQTSAYIMNTADESTATQIIRANGSGIGIKRTANGSYSNLISLNGGGNVKISDRFANQGEMNASFLKYGEINDGNGSYWNLDTGDVHFEGLQLGTIYPDDVYIHYNGEQQSLANLIAWLDQRITNLGG